MPEVSPDDHLNRLLAPQDTEIPWYKSLYLSLHDLIKPEKLPPLEITSKPVAVKSIWGLYAINPKSFYSSSAILASVFLVMMFAFTNKTIQQKIRQSVDLIDPNLKPYIAPKKPDVSQGGGGGG